MKSGVAAFGVALAGKLANTPGVVMYITAGEETDCTGAAAMARETSLPRVGALVVAEPTGNQPLVGHKGALWLEAVTTGVTAHGSMPEKGVNAVHKPHALSQRCKISISISPGTPFLAARHSMSARSKVD